MAINSINCRFCYTFVAKILNMATISEIINFANRKIRFSRNELIKYLNEADQSVSSNAVSIQLDRLVKNHELIRESRGIYKLTSDTRRTFIALCSNRIDEINKQIKDKFPFVSFCVWSSEIIISYMHHVPNINYIFIDVERDATEAIFSFMSENSSLRVFHSPGIDEYDKYINGTDSIIIRTLISEAPLQMVDGFSTPTIEKVLVDIVGDIEFSFLQGSELNYIYPAIFERHNINKNKLLRYASRRGRKEEVKKLLIDNKL